MVGWWVVVVWVGWVLLGFVSGLGIGCFRLHVVGLWVVVFWVGWVLLGGVRWLLVRCSGLVMLFGGVL